MSMPLNFAIVAREKKTEKSILSFLKKRNHKISRKPDFVIVAGGDGTILYSERLFPNVPKIVLRDKSICVKCYSEVAHLAHVVMQVEKKNFSIIRESKLEAKLKGKRITALNEIQLRNIVPVEGIRLAVSANGKKLEDIGDGVIISTPHGSSGYFYSATGKTFQKGIGIAFNNSHNRKPSMVVPENSRIEVKLLRGHASVAYDNDKSHIFQMKENQKITIKKSKQMAKFVVLKN